VIELSRYALETLRQDEEFILYRARSRNDGTQILVLSLVAEYPRPECLKRLEHEYLLREELDPTWAAPAIAMARDRERTVVLLKDPGGVPLDRLLGQPLDVAFSLRLAIGLSNAIDRLHRHGIIHKDIKPANVLVNTVTGQCWLTGFGIASRLPRERQAPEPPEFVAGTLAYMAPEQTGRMNRSIDSRSDLYALGVTLYETLTGSLPFTASDPMEWVHCHIARQPVPPKERWNNLPATVSAIIMKLLAKTAEERYQTAAGVERDLRRCLVEWERGAAGASPYQIQEFPLGEHDTPDRLLIPEKLYGRASQIDRLLASFSRIVVSGRPELLLVSGYSGIGKSSVVNELHKVIVPLRGLFASGKFDQYTRDIPYGTLVQAFQSLIRPLLGKGEAELGTWRDALQEALGPNAQLIVDLVPELKLIIGEQEPVPELSLQDAKGRFQLVFRRFIGVFARPEHPLALFLDDLQWLDAATLDLLEDLLTQPDVQHLMLIGAYRDNEVDSVHPLTRKLEAIRQAGAKVQEILLAPLTSEDLARLIADSIHSEPERLTPLAQLVHDKTAGNPFFVIQFISTLAEEGLLTFDHGAARWSWELDRIHAKGYTDNVVDLMIGKLSRLPVETQNALQQLACLGNAAKITTLSIVCGTSETEVHSHLWEAVRLELVACQEGVYRFIHDRILEAAYSLIAEHSRAEIHLKIGRLLAARIPPESRGEAIFEIANQFNRGAALITSRDEREEVAQLNLTAAKRAKASTVYDSALKYLTAGAALLADDCWDRRHELIFWLELNRAECEFLTGELAAAEERLAKLAARAANTVEQATVACLRMDLYTTHDQSDRAVGVCLDYLRHLGIEWSPHPTKEEAQHEYEQIWTELGSRTIEELIELPLMSDPASIATLDVLTKVLSPALFTDANFLSLAICRAVNLSLSRGNSDGSCVTYVWLGMITGPHFGNYRAGFQFGRLGYELVEQRGLKRFQARTYLWFGQFVMPWTKHVRAGRDLMRRAFEAANQVGDLTVAAYSSDALNTNLLAVGDPLAEVQQQAENGLVFAQKVRFGIVTSVIIAQLGLIRTLRGLTAKFGSFDDGHLDELQFEQHLANEPILALPECWYWIRKLQARFFAGDYESAVEASTKARRLLWTSPSLFETAEYHFYGALARAALCDAKSSDKQGEQFQPGGGRGQFGRGTPLHHSNTPSLRAAGIEDEDDDEDDDEDSLPDEASSLPVGSTVSQRRRENEGPGAHFQALAEHHKQLALWAENCPENFETRVALVAAEIARIEGLTLDSERLYEQAIHSARANGFVHNEALANELAARFYAGRGFEKIAHAYLRDSRHCYLRWGADGKARQLEQLYPQLREAPSVPAPTTTIEAPLERLDLATVIKISQAVSGEILLEKLIETLLKTAVEQAGAERGLLVLPDGEQYRIEAEIGPGAYQVDVRLRQAPVSSSELPESILRYVIRSQQKVILDDASTHTLFSEDEYLRQRHPKSVLCLPLLKQSRLISVLYLENNLAPRVFTPKRVAMLELLASQAAISLDHARLYSELSRANAMLEHEINERLRAEAVARRSEAYLAEAESLSKSGSWAWNPATKEITHWSQERYRLFGFDPKAGIPSFEAILQRIHPEDRIKWLENGEDTIRERRDSDLEFRVVLPDGEIKHLYGVGHPIFSESGDLVEVMGLGMDITERKRVERELRQKEVSLREAQSNLAHVSRLTTMGELAVSIVHEVNQPIAGIVTNANAALRWLAGTVPNLNETGETIRRIVRDGKRAGEIVGRIRALAKKAPPQKDWLDLNQAIAEVIAIARSELQRHRVSLQTQLAYDLPLIMGDRIQLQQVVLNLLVNAIEAMSGVSEGPRDLWVSSQKVTEIPDEANEGKFASGSAVGAARTYVLIAVRDSGPGLDPSALNRLFDAFYTTKPQGLGMGLPISRSIVEAHGGLLWATANVPRGAVFQFTLPT
jgi:PAS domain S-box-containing protein